MKKAWIIIIILLVIGIFAGGYIVGRQLHKPIVITQHDTILIKPPAPIEVKIVDAFKIPRVPIFAYFVDTINYPHYVDDTLIIPIEQKTYEGEQYKAWVSGYLPSLDSILIHNTTHTIIQPQSNGNPSILGVYAEVGSVVIPKFGIYAGLEADIRIKQYRITARGGMTNIENAVKPYVLIGLKYQISGMR